MTPIKMATVTLAAATILLAPACGKSNVTEDTNAPSAPVGTSSSPTPTSATGTSPSPGAAAATITIEGFKYSDVTVPPGAQVTVINKDSAKHTVTSDASGGFDVDVAGNGQATFTAPSTPGSYPYHCTYHPSMHGTLTVS